MITDIAQYLSTIHGGIGFYRGKVNEYLGTDLDYTKKRIVNVLMVNYLKTLLKDFL